MQDVTVAEAKNASLKGAFFIHTEENNAVQIYILDPRHNIMKDYEEKKEGIISIICQLEGTYSLVIKNKNVALYLSFPHLFFINERKKN